MKKIILSLFVGAGFGIIDIISMVVQDLPWYEIASAFSLWVIAAFFNFYTEMKIKGFIKGIIISSLIWIPAFFLVFPQGTKVLLIITITNIVLGSLLGLIVEKIKK